MNQDKVIAIMKAMQGITYLEWKKLSHSIETNFTSRANTQRNKILIASPAEIVENYERTFSALSK